MYPVYDYLYSETKCEDVKIAFPKQHQYIQPGLEYLMCPRPISENSDYSGSGKLNGKVAIVTGGDSGIGKMCIRDRLKVFTLYLEEKNF